MSNAPGLCRRRNAARAALDCLAADRLCAGSTWALRVRKISAGARDEGMNDAHLCCPHWKATRRWLLSPRPHQALLRWPSTPRWHRAEQASSPAGQPFAENRTTKLVSQKSAVSRAYPRLILEPLNLGVATLARALELHALHSPAHEFPLPMTAEVATLTRGVQGSQKRSPQTRQCCDTTMAAESARSMQQQRIPT